MTVRWGPGALVLEVVYQLQLIKALIAVEWVNCLERTKSSH